MAPQRPTAIILLRQAGVKLSRDFLQAVAQIITVMLQMAGRQPGRNQG
jgi:hypothetical protein